MPPPDPTAPPIHREGAGSSSTKANFIRSNTVDSINNNPLIQSNQTMPEIQPTPSTPNAIFSMRIVSIDYYLESPPNPYMDRMVNQFWVPGGTEEEEDSRKFLNQVPVIRIFGATLNGQKACLHVHQAFPYVYIPYEGSLDPKELQTNIIQIGISINRALSIAYNRRYPSDPKSNFLASIILVKGIPFYGYHSGYEYFMKIYLIDPSTVSKLAELFDSGAIMGKRIQVHEAHIPFLLQFLIDYNLYGMGFIHLKDMRFREPFYVKPRPPPPQQHPISTPQQQVNQPNGPNNETPSLLPRNPSTNSLLSPSTPTQQPTSTPTLTPNTTAQPYYFTPTTIANQHKWPSRYNISRQTHCELELDGWVLDIVNRQFVTERRTEAVLDVKGKKTKFEDATSFGKEKLVQSLRAIWEDEKNRLAPGTNLPPTKLSPNTPRTRNEWYSERKNFETLFTKTKECLDKYFRTSGNNDLIADISTLNTDDGVMTAFESITALHPRTRMNDQVSVSSSPSSEFYLSQREAHDPRTDNEWIQFVSQIPGVVDEEAIEDWKMQRYSQASQRKQGGSSQRSQNNENSLKVVGGKLRVNVDVVEEGEESGQESVDLDLGREKVGEETEDEDNELVDILDWMADGGDEVNTQNEKQPRKEDGNEEEQQEQDEATDRTETFLQTEYDEHHRASSPDPPEDDETTVVHNQQDEEEVEEFDEIQSLEEFLNDMSHTQFEQVFRDSQTISLPSTSLSTSSTPSKVVINSKPTRQDTKESIDLAADPSPPLQKLPSQQPSSQPSASQDIEDFTFNIPQYDGTGDTPSPPLTTGKSKSKGRNPVARRPISRAPPPLKSTQPSTSQPFEFIDSDDDIEDADDFPSGMDTRHKSDKTTTSAVQPKPAKRLKLTYRERSKLIASELGANKEKATQKPALESTQHQPSSQRSQTTKSIKPSSQTQPRPQPQPTQQSQPSDLQSDKPTKNPPRDPKPFQIDPLPKLDSEISTSKYFTKTITKMWSSDSDGMDVDMFQDPPVALSPTKKSVTRQPVPMDVDTDMDIPENNYIDEEIPLPPPSNDTIMQDIPTTDPLTPTPKSKIVPTLWRPFKPPPTAEYLLSTCRDYNIPEVVYREPYFSNPNDVPKRTITFANREFRLPGDGLKWTEEAPIGPPTVYHNDHSGSPLQSGSSFWIPARAPPPLSKVLEWMKQNEKESDDKIVSTGEKNDAKKARMKDISQIELPTQNTFGFKYTQMNSDKFNFQKEWLTTLSVEIHARSRGSFNPDPKIDPVCAIFYCIQSDDENEFPTNGRREGYHVGAIVVDLGYDLCKTGIIGYAVTVVPDEKALFETLVAKVRGWDPDIMVGFEIHNSSWGYLIERAHFAFKMNLIQDLSRTVKEANRKKFGVNEDSYGHTHSSSIHIIGRLMLNVWRLMKSELNTTSYTLENFVYHVLRERIPKYSYQTLTTWYDQPTMLNKWKTLKYYLTRVQMNIQLLDETELISQKSEFARVYGVDFYSVIARGSQIKVESLMCRIAKPENFIMVSASRKQIVRMRAAECLPLVMEPQSRFYNGPVIVLDFQSLYPSIMTAYNYCFSTCLGRVAHTGQEHALGVTDYVVPAPLLELLKDHVNISPNGIVFVKHYIRKGVLGRMLTEMLETRVMIKNAMKIHKHDKAVVRLLNSRQLGLKLLANVTYGYTAASFSGRMPCVDIADSIVQTGREILEQSTEVINSTAEWGARVVYGDTDSLFIHLPGASKESAFRIGKEIVDKITSMNPYPITLKFEKVYLPCILLAKKRYVGFKYESLDDTEPVFDAKGIETVRRDGCPAVAKTMENCLKILFRTQDLSELKSFLHRQWTKILTGRVSIQDFIIAKAVKLGTYSTRGLPPPGAIISLENMKRDHRAEPQYGERVPYVVVYSNDGGTRLVDSVVSPYTLMQNTGLRLHGVYYITKQIIPPLERVLNLVGADIRSWYADLPKIQRTIQYSPADILYDKAHQQLGQGQQGQRPHGKTTLEQFYKSQHCLVCFELTKDDLCDRCLSNPTQTLATLTTEFEKTSLRWKQLTAICRTCSPQSVAFEPFHCISLDCPIYYLRMKQEVKVKAFEQKYQELAARLESRALDLRRLLAANL